MNQQPITALPGVELGKKILRYEVKQDPRMAVFIANVGVDDTHEQPTLIVGRKTLSGGGRSFMIPLSSAWQYNERDRLDEKAKLCATMLFGPYHSKGEAHMCLDVIVSHLPKLFAFAPEDERRGLDAGMQRLLEQFNVSIETGDGKVLVDAGTTRH